MMIRRCNLLGALALVPALAGGAGLSSHEQSSSAQGTALAGNAALGEDASSQWYNPATLEQLRGTQLSAQVQTAWLERRYEDSGGGAGDDTTVGRTETALYFADAVNDHLSLGLAVNTPFRVSRDYHPGWAGSAYALSTEVTSRNINPSLAWRVTPRMTLGAGVSYQTMEFRLDNSVYQMDLEDSGAGWNIGLVYRAAPGHKLGLAWRSEVNYRLRGTLAGAGGGTTRASTSVDMPGTVTGSWAGDITDRTSLLLSVSMTEWQQWEFLTVKRQGAPTLIEELRWDNSVMASFGVRHATPGGAILRLGYANETSSQGNDEERAPLATDARRQWLTVGARFNPWSRLSVDVHLARLLFDRAGVDRSENRDATPGAETLRGRYDLDGTRVGAQLNYRF